MNIFGPAKRQPETAIEAAIEAAKKSPEAGSEEQEAGEAKDGGLGAADGGRKKERKKVLRSGAGTAPTVRKSP